MAEHVRNHVGKKQLPQEFSHKQDGFSRSIRFSSDDDYRISSLISQAFQDRCTIARACASIISVGLLSSIPPASSAASLFAAHRKPRSAYYSNASRRNLLEHSKPVSIAVKHLQHASVGRKGGKFSRFIFNSYQSHRLTLSAVAWEGHCEFHLHRQIPPCDQKFAKRNQRSWPTAARFVTC